MLQSTARVYCALSAQHQLSYYANDVVSVDTMLISCLKGLNNCGLARKKDVMRCRVHNYTENIPPGCRQVAIEKLYIRPRSTWAVSEAVPS